MNTYSGVNEIKFIDVRKLESGFHIFYQRLKVSPEAKRLAKYKEKKKEFCVATLQFDVTFCTPITCAPSLHCMVRTDSF